MFSVKLPRRRPGVGTLRATGLGDPPDMSSPPRTLPLLPALLGERYDLAFGRTGLFDEMFDDRGCPRPHYQALFEQLSQLSIDEFSERRRAVDAAFVSQGIGFTVYEHAEGAE